MKRLYLILTVIVALFVFASLAVAKPPFWDDQVNSPARFKVLGEFGNAAVSDKETGLVWEKSPGDTDGDGDVDNNDDVNWASARSHCANKNVGGRKGWRLPSFAELASLVDTSQPAPRLPPGHPFDNVQSSGYWSATTSAFNTAVAFHVDFDNGFVFTFDKSNGLFVWCVRGGMNADAY